VVADADGLAAVDRLPDAARIKTARLDQRNISHARNRALALAAGEVVAFLDDDAVPEPTWLDALVAPFRDPGVGGAAGPVRGRNGISYQSRAPFIDHMGQTHDGAAPPAGSLPKLVGTNMALRRQAAVALGGFDPRYRFFLEDAEISLRLARAGHDLVHVPGAEVHHSFAASARRRTDRFPTDLGDIGRSVGIFLASYTPPDLRDQAREMFVAAERRRLIGHMQRGSCEPRDVAPALAEFQDALHGGLDTGPCHWPKIPAPPPFLPFTDAGSRQGHVALASRPARREMLMENALDLAGQGHVISAFIFGRHTLFHKVDYDPRGIWLQTGGQFGRSEREAPLFQPISYRDRVTRELGRVHPVRCPQEIASAPQIRWI